MAYHTPVLLNEVVQALQPQPGSLVIDGTVGGGGHAAALLQQMQPGGRLLGLDADLDAVHAARLHLAAVAAPENRESVTLLQGNLEQLGTVAHNAGFEQVQGILFDLGVSSHQLDTPERGFSFSSDAPLDMRFDTTRGPMAADLLAEMSEKELADCLYHYGEERFSRRIARAIVERRQQQPLQSTTELAALVLKAVPGAARRSRGIHPATRTFQALRIATNRELHQLEAVLPQAVALLQPGGRLAVISFHSLEDRIVKTFFRSESGYGRSEATEQTAQLRLITRKPITASDAEIEANRRSRSAKLRVAERI